MGQYYKPTLKTEDGDFQTFYSHQYDNGLKLMEHSYVGNNLVAAVLSEIIDTPKKLWWLGDYAEPEDFKNEVLSDQQIKDLWQNKNIEVRPTDENKKWKYNNCYIVNFTKKEYIQLESNNSEKWQICPLCILTAVGNGRGGGDYWGDNADLAGIWAGDEIYVTEVLPETYANKTSCYLFKEEY